MIYELVKILHTLTFTLQLQVQVQGCTGVMMSLCHYVNIIKFRILNTIYCLIESFYGTDSPLCALHVNDQCAVKMQLNAGIPGALIFSFFPSSVLICIESFKKIQTGHS